MVIFNYLYKIIKKIYFILYNPIIRKLRCFRIVDYPLLYLETNKNDGLMRVKFESVKKYCLEHNYEIQTIEPAQMRAVCIPDYTNIKGRVESYISPEVYITEIKTINIYGECGAVFKDKQCLLDIVVQDDEKRYDYTFKPLIRMEPNRIYGIIRYKNKKTDYIDKGIFLIGFGSFNYYHATVEIISRLEYVNSFSEYDEIPILADEVFKRIDSLYTVLNMVNKTNRKIIWIEKHTMYTVGNLIYPSNNCWMPINIRKGKISKPKDFLISKSALDNVRNNVFKIIKSEPPHRKIYISRGNKAFKRLINEDDVEMIFKQKGFEIIDPGLLSFSEQVKIFSEAKVIAGTSGAAMANLIYCAPNTKFICVLPRKYNFYLYSTIAYYYGLECLFIDAEVIDKKKTSSEETYKVDIITIKELLV